MKANNPLPGCRSRFALVSPPTLLGILLLAFLGSVSCPRSFGALLSHDSFAYPLNGALPGQNGGAGFAGAWLAGVNAGVPTSRFQVFTPSLSYPGLASDGVRLRVTAGAAQGARRLLAQPLGTDGTVRYVSLLVRPDATPSASSYFGLQLRGSAGADLFAGKPGGGATQKYVLENAGGAGQVATTRDVIANEVVLLVLRLQFNAGNDNFSLYVNPALGAAEPAVADAVKTNLDLGTNVVPALTGPAAWSMDELRVGETFTAVTPPAPDFQLRPVQWGFVTEHILVTRQVETVDPLPPGRTLTFALDGATHGATIHATTGEFTWVPGELDGGQRRNFTVRATSNANPPAAVTVSFFLDVNEANSLPQLEIIADQTVKEGSEFSYQLVATDSDVPVQNLSYAIPVAPPGLTVSPAGRLTWRPTIAQGGRSYPVTVSAHDTMAGRAERSFTITVENRTRFSAKWQGGSSGDWNVPANWDIGRVPNNTVDDLFDVALDGQQPAAILIPGDVTIHNLFWTAGGSIEIQSAAGTLAVQGTLHWGGGAVAGPGRMTVHGRATMRGGQGGPLVLRDQGRIMLKDRSELTTPLQCEGNVRLVVESTATLGMAEHGGFLRVGGGVPELVNDGRINVWGQEQPIPFIYLNNRGTVTTFANTLDFDTGAGLDMIQEPGGHLSVGAGFDREGIVNGNALFRQGSTIFGQGYIHQAHIEGQIQGRFSFNQLSFGPTAVSRFSLVGTPDRLSATQPIALAGQFELAPLQGFTPGPDDSFQIMSSGGDITGEFANAPFGQRVHQFGSLLLTRAANLRSVSLGRFLPPEININSVPLAFRLPAVAGELGGCFVVPHPAVTLPEGTVAGGTLTVEITENYNAAVDQLAFRPNPTFPEADDIVFEGAFGSVQTVRFRGTAFGTMQLADGLMTCNLNAQADSEAAVALLGRLRYENTELTGNWFTNATMHYPPRTIVVTLTDANGANEVSRVVDFPFLWGIRLPESLQLTNGQQTVLHLQGWFSSQQVLPVPSLTTQWSESCTNRSVLVHPVALLGQQGVIGKAAPYCCTITAQAGLLSAATSLQDSLTEVIPWNELDPIKQGLAKLIFGEEDVQYDFERIVLENQSHACPLFIGMFLTERRVECETTPGGRVSAQGGGDDTNSITTFYTLEALMKGTTSGQRLVNLYWQHAAEVVRIFLQQPFLLNEAKELSTTFHPGVTALLAGRGDTVTITPPMITLVNNFWNLLAQYASPALKAVLQQEQARFDNFQLFQDVTFSEWAGLLGIRVPFQPYLHISLMQREPTKFHLALNDVPGLDFSLWRSEDLKTWGRVTNATFERDGVAIIFTDPTPPAGAAFYQVR